MKNAPAPSPSEQSVKDLIMCSKLTDLFFGNPMVHHLIILIL